MTLSCYCVKFAASNLNLDGFNRVNLYKIYMFMKSFTKGAERLLYETPYMEIMGTIAEGVLCQSGTTQDFEDGGVVDWFNEN